MLNTVFYLVLNMSITSCFVIALLLLVRQIRLLSRRFVFPLWALAFFRLAIPFSLPSRLSLFNFTGGLVKKLITVDTLTGKHTADAATEEVSLQVMNMIGTAGQYAPVEYKTEALRRVFTSAAIIWIIIAAALLLTAVILYYLTGKELKQAVHIKGDLYRSDMLLSPVLSGLFRPRIIIPDSLDPDSDIGRMILAHERVHKHRQDNLWRVLGILITCFHWFNPLTWVMLKAFFSDMERSCDETVILRYNAQERKAYAGALLRFAEDKRLLVSAAFGHSGVKVRIVNVLNYKKLTLIGAAASALLLVAVTVILLTNPQLRG